MGKPSSNKPHVGNMPIENPPLRNPPMTIPLYGASNPMSLSFIGSIKIPNMAWLTNEPIRHDPNFPPILTNLPLDIPKFEGKVKKIPKIISCSFNYGAQQISS